MVPVFRSHGLRTLLAGLIALTPLAHAAGETWAAETSAVDHLTPQSIAALTVRPADLAAVPLVQDYPVEVAQAATKDWLGLPLESIERITVQADPPVGVAPQFAVVLQSKTAISFDRFRSEILDALAPTELEGRPALKLPEDEPIKLCLCLIDDNTLAFGPPIYLKRLIRGVDAGDSDLAAAMRQGEGDKQHVHAAVMLDPIRPLLELGLSAAKQDSEFPPAAREVADGLLLLSRVVLSADFSGERGSSFIAYARDGEAADQLEQLLVRGYGQIWEEILEKGKYDELRNHPEAVVRAWVAYIERISAQQVDAISQFREGDDAFVFGRTTPGDAQAPLITIAITGVLVALLLPAVQAAREAARRNQSMNNVKQVVLALLNYEATYGHLPPQAICAADGTPMLSWRVAVLPFMEEQALYERFKLDEPWNSSNNLPLLAEMPDVFIDPSSGLDTAAGKTHYLGVAGPRAIFTGEKKGRIFASIRDGLANTLAIVQVDDANAVEWTKPADYDAAKHPENPIAGIGSLHPGVFLGGFADGHVRSIDLDVDADVLREILTADGGEKVELEP